MDDAGAGGSVRISAVVNTLQSVLDTLEPGKRQLLAEALNPGTTPAKLEAAAVRPALMDERSTSSIPTATAPLSDLHLGVGGEVSAPRTRMVA